MMQPGNYFGRLLQGQLGQLNNDKHTPYMGLTFEVTHVAVSGAWQEIPQPFDRTVKAFLSPAARESSKKKLDSLGFNGDWNNPEFGPDATGQGVELICKNEGQYENWELAKWGNGDITPPSNEVVRELTSWWKSSGGKRPTPPAMPASKRTPQSPPASAPAEVPAGDPPPVEMPSGEHIPF